MSMNLRHASALALVGWYLMLPPVREPRWLWFGTSEVDAHAPRSKWLLVDSYDTAAECKEALEQDRKVSNDPKAAAEQFKLKTKREVERIQELFADAECIATDDPRLGS